MDFVETEAALSVEMRKAPILVGNQGRINDYDAGESPGKVADSDGVLARQRCGG
jgi:hypothetical protein